MQSNNALATGEEKMNKHIESLIKKTKPEDRFAVIAQYRHDQRLLCAAEARLDNFYEHNYLCDRWGYAHCKMDANEYGIENDREHVALTN